MLSNFFRIKLLFENNVDFLTDCKIKNFWGFCEVKKVGFFAFLSTRLVLNFWEIILTWHYCLRVSD